MSLARTLLSLACAALLAPAALAQSIFEDFESYAINPYSADVLNILSLDENTIANGQGPGLVEDGCTYSCNSGMLQWNGPGWFGSYTKSLVASAPDGDLILHYNAQNYNYVSLQMSAFNGYPDTAIVRVYDASWSLIHTSAPIYLPDASPVTFEYSAKSILRVVIDGQTRPWSPLLDDHRFGLRLPFLTIQGACPGPATATVLDGTPNGNLALILGTGIHMNIVPSGPCAGWPFSLSNPQLLGIFRADRGGVFTLTRTQPLSACGMYVQAMDFTTCLPSNYVQLR